METKRQNNDPLRSPLSLDEVWKASVDIEGRWNGRRAYRRFLRRTTGQTPSPVRHRIAVWSTVAAAALIAVAVIFTVRDINTTKRLRELAAHTSLKNEATLILGGGEQVALSASSRLVNDENGLHVMEKEQEVWSRKNSNSNAEEASATKIATLIVPACSFYHITLQDGTEVTINSSSSMTYPVAFNGHTRRITLNGEAYFDVRHDPQRPFEVVSPDGTVTRVLGTAFNVKSYGSENCEVVLVRGSVNVTSSKGSNATISPGEMASVNDEGTVRVAKADVNRYTSWINGLIGFDGESLIAVAQKLEHRYGVRIHIDVDNPNEIRFGGYIPSDMALDELLDLLNQTEDIKFKIEKDSSITLYK